MGISRMIEGRLASTSLAVAVPTRSPLRSSFKLDQCPLGTFASLARRTNLLSQISGVQEYGNGSIIFAPDLYHHDSLGRPMRRKSTAGTLVKIQETVNSSI